ncbi:hypothetical protein SEA_NIEBRUSAYLOR_114 [Mycobacterium phage NiebruSaylor]|nr:hypothetical protein SEA_NIEBRUSAYLOR_114 [Mycobacterium phage NiebruSaylor]
MTDDVSPGDRALMQAVVKLWQQRWPDREMVAYGVEDGVPWVVAPGALYGLCGYAIIPAEGHPWSARWPDGDLDDCLLAHGGISWYQHPFVGFDAMHAGDIWDGTPWAEEPIPGVRQRITDLAFGVPWSKRWSLEAMVAETKDLARQVAEVRNLENLFQESNSTVEVDGGEN